ncbi:hypothetical protein D9O36_04145 [Zobellia amurskyensis]|uniref:Fibronectin type-III domain-containing protein n=1 Tax=Zobellia amurskyensis TaxID=248905 RepID=A0A7X2ZRE9_9FLAO|nr:ThuA domain-containing protein [Zobellia amurskyensis]MUH35021.1 hypothetical protein [Zobellia amurskyensis]
MKERPIVGLLSALFACFLFFGIACEKDKSDDPVAIAPDIIPPLPPKKLETVQVTDSSITVSWESAKDNVKVVHYMVYQDSIEVARDSLTTYHAENLKPATEYVFSVRASDAAGNNSEFSEKIKVLTEAVAVEDTVVVNDTTQVFSSILRAPRLSIGKVLKNSVELNWELEINASVVKEYRVFQDTIQIGNVNNKSYKVADLMPGEGYSFSVAAVDLVGKESKRSNVVEVETLLEDIVEQDTIAPTVPTGLKATEIQANSMRLLWSAATDSVGVSTYTVYNDTTVVGLVADTFYVLENLEANTAYSFRVSASDDAENESPRSEPLLISTVDEVKKDSVVLGAPKDLQVVDLGSTTASFSWSPENDGTKVAEYSIYLDEVLVANTVKPEYLTEELTANTEYSFSVAAADELGNQSEKSNILNFTTLSEKVVFKDSIAPTIPQNVKIEELTTASLRVRWNASADSIGVANYRVFQNEDLLATTTETSYLVEKLSPDTTYSFSISALDEAQNESRQSDLVSVTTEKEVEEQKASDTTAPTIPDGLNASEITQTTVNLAWEASEDSVGVSGYSIFQNGKLLASATKTAYRVEGLSPSTEYTFSVAAYDVAENQSQQSTPLQLTTEAEIYVDDVPPSEPNGLRADEVTETSIDLRWNTATDNIGVTEYIIYQNGQRVKSATGTGYSMIGLTSNTTYSFNVSAVDAAQNESQQSETLVISTIEEAQTVDKILVFTKTAAFRHGSIEKGVATLKALGQANNFEVEQSENASDFTFNNLSRYKTVVFLNTTGDVLDAGQQRAFESYIQSGGSYMGVHAATDTEYDWPWYGKLVGAYFNGHPSIQEATLNVVNSNHSSTSHLPNNWVRTEEWYNFKDIYSGINPLILLDESTYNGGTNGANHPFSWYHSYDGGRAFYTAGGHSNASYDEADFRAHLLGGLFYCLGR